MWFRCNSPDFNSRWDGNWVGLRCKYVHLDGGEIVHGWRLHKYLDTWIHVKQDLDGSDTSIGCRWYTIIVILFEVKCNLNVCVCVCGGGGGGGGGMGGWGLDWVETHILRPGYIIKVELGWSWGAILLTWMDVRHEMDGCEMSTSWPGWRWDATWIKEILDMDRCDTVHGGGWDNNLGNVRWGMTCMEVRRTFSDVDGLEIWDLDGAEMLFAGPAFGLDITWIGMRQKCGILDWVAARPGWRWHVNLSVWVDMGQNVGGGENHIANCIDLRWGLNGCEPRYGWWLKNFWTWMEVRW